MRKTIILDKWIGFVWFMMFNATFKDRSDISWWSVLLVEETGVQTLSHNVKSSTLVMNRVRTHNFSGDKH